MWIEIEVRSENRQTLRVGSLERHDAPGIERLGRQTDQHRHSFRRHMFDDLRTEDPIERRVVCCQGLESIFRLFGRQTLLVAIATSSALSSIPSAGHVGFSHQLEKLASPQPHVEDVFPALRAMGR